MRVEEALPQCVLNLQIWPVQSREQNGSSLCHCNDYPGWSTELSDLSPGLLTTSQRLGFRNVGAEVCPAVGYPRVLLRVLHSHKLSTLLSRRRLGTGGPEAKGILT